MINYFNNILDNDIFSYVVWENTVWKILISAVIFVLLFFFIKFLLNRLNKSRKYLINNKKEKHRLVFLSTIINKIPRRIFIIIELYISTIFLTFSDSIKFILKVIFLFILTVFIIKLCIECLNFSVEKILRNDKTAKNTIEIIIKTVVRILWIFLFLMNIWVNLTPLLAWFWVAWIAVAFALQNILTDLFSSFSIILSKPFIVWDYVKVWEWSSEKIWTVKKISLKSTTLQTLQWQEVIIPNSNILATEIINYRTMKNRRQRISIWVTYNTWIKNLKKIPEIIKNIVSSQENVDFERCYLEKMWDFSINFLMSYNILNPDYQKGLEINEKIYLELIEKFEKAWIEFAFPSQTIYMKND